MSKCKHYVYKISGFETPGYCTCEQCDGQVDLFPLLSRDIKKIQRIAHELEHYIKGHAQYF